jgi:hypothetical protein
MAAALSGSPGERARLVRQLVEKIIVDEKTIIIKLRRAVGRRRPVIRIGGRE